MSIGHINCRRTDQCCRTDFGLFRKLRIHKHRKKEWNRIFLLSDASSPFQTETLMVFEQHLAFVLRLCTELAVCCLHCRHMNMHKTPAEATEC